MRITKALVIFILSVALIVAMPFAVIWSLNAAFDLGVAYGWRQWVSILILVMAVRGFGSKR